MPLLLEQEKLNQIPNTTIARILGLKHEIKNPGNTFDIIGCHKF